MSIVITWESDNGLDGVTNVSASSTYARSAGDDHAYEAETGGAAPKDDPIGLIAPRASVEKAAEDLTVTSLLSTASAQQRDHATTVDDYIAFNVQVVFENGPVLDLGIQVVNLATGVIVETLTITDPTGTGFAFTSNCVMVPTGHAIRLTGGPGPGDGVKVTLVLEPTDDPSDFAKLCCCGQGGGNGEVCCTPDISPGSFVFPQADFSVSGNGALSVAYQGLPDPGHDFRVGACNVDATTVVSIQRDPNFPAAIGAVPGIQSVGFFPPIGLDIAALKIVFDFTGVDSQDTWLVQFRNPCGCCATFVLFGQVA